LARVHKTGEEFMSIANPGLKRNLWWKNQPYKGVLFIALIAVVSWIFELLLGQVLQLDVTSKLIYITIFFVWWWHLGFSLNGIPCNGTSADRRYRAEMRMILDLAFLVQVCHTIKH
jgi:hypothetical protein